MNPAQAKHRIIREAVKDQHTSHWDQDMLSWSQLEALMLTGKTPPATRYSAEEFGNETEATTAPAKTSPSDSTP